MIDRFVGDSYITLTNESILIPSFAKNSGPNHMPPPTRTLYFSAYMGIVIKIYHLKLISQNKSSQNSFALP